MAKRSPRWGYKLDCIPDRRGMGEKKFRANPHVQVAAASDLTPKMPPVYDQGQEGSCTANGTGGACHYEELVQDNVPVLVPARQYIYYSSRVRIEGSPPSQDTGSSVGDAVKGVSLYGYPDEPQWPYDQAHFAATPTAAIDAEAAPQKITDYARVADGDLASIKQAIDADKTPVIIGFTVYQSFDNIGADGIMPMPHPGESVLGGHCVLIVGYDDAKTANGITGYFKVRNSWGTTWGVNGYFWMPYAFVGDTSQTSDLWRVNKVPGGTPTPTPTPTDSLLVTVPLSAGIYPVGVPIGTAGAAVLSLKAALAAGAYTVGSTPPTPTPTPTPTPVGPTEAQVLAAVNAEFAKMAAQVPSYLRPFLRAVNVRVDAAISQAWGTKVVGNIDWSQVVADLIPAILKALQDVLAGAKT